MQGRFYIMMQIAIPEYENISRKIANDNCMAIYDQEKNKLKLVLKDVNRISPTIDLYKSQN